MAYVTRAILQQEAAWYFTAWQPVIGSASAYDTWLDTLVTRVAKQVEWRVGTAFYGTGSTTLDREILKEAELCLGQYYLLLASAAIADTSDDPLQNPGIGHGKEILADAKAYKERYEEILNSFDAAKGRVKFGRPRAATRETTPVVIPETSAAVDWERAG